jgi:hypothetical protein
MAKKELKKKQLSSYSQYCDCNITHAKADRTKKKEKGI